MKKVKYRFTVLSLTSTYKIYIYPSLQRTRILISPPVNVVCFTITFAYAGGIIRHDSRSYLPGLARHTSVFLELSQPTTDGSLKEQMNTCLNFEIFGVTADEYFFPTHQHLAPGLNRQKFVKNLFGRML